MNALSNMHEAPRAVRSVFVRHLKRSGSSRESIHAALGALDAAARAAARHKAGEPPKGSPFHRLMSAVCRTCGVTPRALRSADRSRAVARPRQIVMYLATVDLGLSTPVVGRLLGGRDHTTVIHGRDTIARMIETNAVMRERVERIRREVTRG